jgi:hypothetical protein
MQHPNLTQRHPCTSLVRSRWWFIVKNFSHLKIIKMLIKNLKSEFSTDQYFDTEIFHILIADEVVEGIKKRKALLDQNEWLTGNTNIEYTPLGIGVRNSQIQDDTITVRIGVDAMLFIISDDNGQMYETESVPYVALDKERFLLQYTDEGGVIEYEDGDDVEDFEAVYANSWEEAKEILMKDKPTFQAEGEDPATDEILLQK